MYVYSIYISNEFSLSYNTQQLELSSHKYILGKGRKKKERSPNCLVETVQHSPAMFFSKQHVISQTVLPHYIFPGIFC